MSIRTYVDAVIQILSAYPELERDVALSQVILALREPYLSNLLLVNDLDKNKEKTVNELLMELKNVTSIENESLSSSLFSKRSQLPNEDANAYGNALLTMARDAFGKTLTNEQLKKRVLERFIFGLREPIGSRVRIQLPKTYNEALMLATVIESEFSRTRIHATEQLRVREQARPRYQGKLPNVRQIPERRYNNYGKRPSTRPINTVHNVETTETRRCYRCSKVGHLARACPQKPDYKPRSDNDSRPNGQHLNYQRGSHAQT